MILPEHMNFDDRNRRLYETLKGMGLFVTPIPNKHDPSRLDGMTVSAGLPPADRPEDAAENSPVGGVCAAAQGPQIGERIASTEGLGNGVVIDFPPVGR